MRPNHPGLSGSPRRELPSLVWATSLWCLSGCAQQQSIAEPVHFGGAFAMALAQASSDAEDLPTRTQVHGDDTVPSGFLELGFGNNDSLLLTRLAYLRTEHAMEGDYGTGTLDQVMAFTLYAPRLLGDDDLGLRALVGVGFGWTNFDVPSDTPYDGWNGGEVGLALGGEVDFAQHFTVGAMGWAAIAGGPGDTAGEITTAMIYGGIRF